MSDAAILDVRDLQVEIPLSRGTVHAVDGASFELAPGEALGLVGESGSGKTMTLRAILGLLPHPGEIVGGQVRVRGRGSRRGRPDAGCATCAARASR